MEQVTVIARIKAKSQTCAQVREELLQLVNPTRRENGCINYDLHQEVDDPTVFVFYENWSSETALEKHLQSAHIQSYLARADALLEGWTLSKLVKLEP